MTTTERIQRLYELAKEASASFISKDPAPVLSMWSRANDVSILAAQAPMPRVGAQSNRAFYGAPGFFMAGKEALR